MGEDPASGAFEIARLDVYALEAKIDTPVTASFGSIPARVSALLRIEESGGVAGWGEIWGNFPYVTSAYRAALACRVLPEALLGAVVEAPGAFSRRLADRLHVLAVQAAEPGPVAAVLAAVNQALWDLAARRQGLPLRRALNEGAAETIPVYASGLNPTDGAETAARARDAGFRAFKLKIGFGDEVDRRNLRRLRRMMKEGDRLFVDANQRWPLREAIERAAMLEEMEVGWWEEPMPADAPPGDWRALRDATRLPLAGGENLRGADAFEAAHAYLAFVQPDVGKWGGIDGCYAVARKAIERGRTYCPHWLAGGVGLMHSAHLLAAAGGDGLLEVDANPNPLRSRVAGHAAVVHEGKLRMTDAPGIGVESPIEDLSEFVTMHESFPKEGTNRG